MNLPGKCWSSVGVVPSVAAILNMAAPAVLDLGQFSAFFCSSFCCCGPGASGLSYAIVGGYPGEARHFERQGAFFYCPAGFQSARHGAAACARNRLQRSGQCLAQCVRGSAAFFVLLSFRERQCSETDSHFAAGHICRTNFCGYKKPFAMAHGLPVASQKVWERCYALFLKAGQRSLQCLAGFSGTCQSRSSEVI